jgi:hypothetical protein
MAPAVRYFHYYDTPGLQRSNTAHVQDNVQTTTSNLDIVSCFTKHRFITERIMIFSEKSETYLGWKSTFKDVMYEIKAVMNGTCGSIFSF